METQLSRLESILREEVSAYAALVSRLPFKIALIKKNRVEQLERMVGQEETEQKRLFELGAARVACVQDLITTMPAGTSCTLSGILPHLGATWRRTLQELGEQLAQLVSALREGQATCTILLRTSLEFVDFTMQIVGRAMVNAQPALYGSEPAPAYAPSILLDRRA